MVVNNNQTDEPVSPAGRLFLRPELNQVINIVVGLKNPVNIDAVKVGLTNSIVLQHPRFYSLLVKDSRGREHWRKTKFLDIDQHIIIRNEPLTVEDSFSSDEDIVNEYMADLAVSCPLSLAKPLWEIHLLMAHKCVVFRIHHALGDGISLMSMFLSTCRRADDPSRRPAIDGLGPSSSSSVIRRKSLVDVVKMVWYTMVFLVEFVKRSLWLKDVKTVLIGGDGVELWPRKLATAKFMIDDMKLVKKAICKATINDVLFGVISHGLSKYIDLQSPGAVQKGAQITGVAMINLRPQPGIQDIHDLMENKPGSRWGNKVGMTLLPVYYHKGGDDPLQYVKRAKGMIDKKKCSLDPLCSYKIGDFLMSCFGAKLASSLNYRFLCNTTFTISNLVGPRENMTICSNPIDYIRALTMHMVSYAGRADMQILVAKNIIPEPKILAKCFEDALLEMKEAAMATK